MCSKGHIKGTDLLGELGRHCRIIIEWILDIRYCHVFLRCEYYTRYGLVEWIYGAYTLNS
jgi:hypothetical protein